MMKSSLNKLDVLNSSMVVFQVILILLSEISLADIHISQVSGC